MTAPTRARSCGTCTSFSIIDAMMRTSYGVRFFESAYSRSTSDHACSNASSWSSTSSCEVVSSVKSYVAGKEEALEVRRVVVLELRGHVLHVLGGGEVGLGPQRRRDPALLLGDLVHGGDPAAISFRVKPSGKTMRRIGFGGAVSTEAGRRSRPRPRCRRRRRGRRPPRRSPRRGRSRRPPRGARRSCCRASSGSRSSRGAGARLPLQVAREQVRGRDGVLRGAGLAGPGGPAPS